MNPRLQPYIALTRLNRPIGIWLAFFPAAWGVLLSPAPVHGALLLVMLVGATLTRSAGCILNDITDRKLDAKVARTKTRPLASGTVPLKAAWLLLVLLGVLALYLALLLPLGVMTIALFAVPMIAIYPWMKRFSWWPQLFLGVTFNLGALIGWAATGMALALPAWLLYAACLFWTLGYDTIYAVQDMEDDRQAGIKSTALRVGRHLRSFVAFCYALMLLFLSLAAFEAGVSLVVYGGIAGAALHALWQLRLLGNLAPARAGALFASNQYLGLLIFVALLIGRYGT
jgi:4-hydroxybenzoate polyprenyltransferase